MTSVTAAMYEAAGGLVNAGLTPADRPAHFRRMPVEPEWTALRVDVAADAADAVVNFLIERGANGIVTEDAPGLAGAGRLLLEAHVPSTDGPALAAAVRAYLHELERLDAAWTTGTVAMVPVPAVDWESVYRSHHTPLAIGRRLLIAPPWDVPDVPGREVLVIEPGMAFGTGQHATTRTCLEAIEALGAARLGVPRVAALDVDVAVLPLARANLVRNGAGRVALFGGTVGAVRGRFDVVVANILADTLVAEADALAAVVAPCGHLVLSGLLADQVDRVLAAFPGWRLAATRADDPWRTLDLAREAA